MIELQDIWSATDDGRKIIEDYYSEVSEEHFSRGKKFRIRNETAPSCSIKKFNNIWCVTDWGDEGHPLNPIEITMKEERCDYIAALKLLAERYHVIEPKEEYKSIEFEPKKPEDVTGEISWETVDYDESDLRIFGNHVESKMLAKYGWKKIGHYKKVLEDKIIIKRSSKNQPIYVRECRDGKKVFYKFYSPKEKNKAYRFFYYPVGGKSANYTNGLTELREDYEKHIEGGGIKENMDPVCICCGERDAMNAYSFGYYPIWFNSETYIPSSQEIKDIAHYTSAVYLCPDLDETGKRQGKKMSLTHPNLRVIWLPDELLSHRDWRGNPMKDLRDWVSLGHGEWEFRNLARIAGCCQFIKRGYTDNGECRYNLDLANLLYFLEMSDFSTVKDNGGNIRVVRQEDNILKNFSASEIKTFIIEELKRRYAYKEEINLILSTNKLNDSLFEMLPLNNSPLAERSANEELYPVQNGFVKVSAESIDILKKDSINTVYEEQEIIEYDFKIMPKPFLVSREGDKWQIDLLNTKSKYYQFAISTSRNYWMAEFNRSGMSLQDFYKERKSRITAAELSEKENDEQILSLINKLYVIGYLASRYKSPSRPWAVYAMDNFKGINFESNGRSGKSLFFKLLECVCNTVIINGRQKKLIENAFLYDRVYEHTHLIKIDDIEKSIDINFFFDDISGDLYINRKRQASCSIAYEKSPKFIFTSNFVPINLDASTEGRLIFCTFSDYYHVKSETNDFPNTYTVWDEFGKNLMSEYDLTDWQEDMSFIFHCVQLYQQLQPYNIKLNPPLHALVARRDSILIGEAFEEWATYYFSEQGELNNLVNKQDAFAAYKSASGDNSCKMPAFTKKLKRYAKKMGYLYNGSLDGDKAERIIRKNPLTKITSEYIRLSRANS